MNTVKYKDLKWGIYTSPQSGDAEFERYILENQEDVKEFIKKYPTMNKVGMAKRITEVVAEGRIVIATDSHRLSGFPTWCIESVIDTEHPSAMNRLRLGKIITK